MPKQRRKTDIRTLRCDSLKEIIKTPFGKAKISSDGYYRITHGKYNSKMLHRLLFEKFYKCTIPKEYIIHHKNGIKTDNCILNLQLMRREAHQSYHNQGVKNSMYGKNHTEKAISKIREAKIGDKNPCYGKPRPKKIREKISIKTNTSGYFRVTKRKKDWLYQYRENGKKKYISSKDIAKLKNKVLSKGLEWKEFKDDVII